MTNWIETIIALFMLLIIIVTAISEPVISIKYAKASIKSGGTVVAGIVKIISKVVLQFTDKTGVNETYGNGTNVQDTAGTESI